MTSRNALRIALGLYVLPLILQTACFSKPERPEPDNALRCNCACDDAGTRTVFVTASAHDAEETGDLPAELTGPDLDIGARVVGLRFEGIMIPRHATITNAYVQFSAVGATNADTEVFIAAELSANPAPFAAAVHDLTARLSAAGGEVDWSPPAWSGGDAGAAQQTPDLAPVLQELVDLAAWDSTGTVVLLIAGTGGRAAMSFDGAAARAPVLVVEYDASISATIPVCASSAPPQALTAECALVEQTFEGLAGSCGYPNDCTCTPVEIADHSDTFQSAVCESECPSVPVDETCSNFNPYEYAKCLQSTASVELCKQFVSATEAEIGEPVCVASGSALAFHMFGRRSRCELEGLTSVKVGDREPEQDPATDGILEVVGGNCASGGCNVQPFFDLQMANITFEVKWASDPTFSDLSATGHGLETAAVDGVEAVFGDDAIDATGNGQRGAGTGMVINSTNDEPLVIGLDWANKACDMTGNLAESVDGEVPDGVCENDNSIACAADSPDCDDVGGVCLLEEVDEEEMSVNVALTGKLANQPPTANAGVDQPDIECTSPAGASFLLDGRGSHDPDGDLALARWRRGNRLGTQVSDDLIAVQSLGVGQTETWYLLALDSNAQTDLDDTKTTVVDTTAPVISCNLPATIVPPKTTPVSFTATATDVCDAEVTPAGAGFECYGFTKKGARYDVACHITLDGDTIVISNSGGVGTIIDWAVGVTDASGNASTATCRTRVVNPIKG